MTDVKGDVLSAPGDKGQKDVIKPGSAKETEGLPMDQLSIDDRTPHQPIRSLIQVFHSKFGASNAAEFPSPNGDSTPQSSVQENSSLFTQENRIEIQEFARGMQGNSTLMVQINRYEQRNTQTLHHDTINPALYVSGSRDLHIEQSGFNIGTTVKKGPEEHSSFQDECQESNDAEDFLRVLRKHTPLKLEYNVCGKRKTLKKPEKHNQPILKIIGIEGKDQEPQSFQLDDEKRGRIGNDIEEIKLNQIHAGSGGSDPRHVLMVGNPGEGKTTTAKCYGMAALQNHEGNFNGIRLVLYVSILEVDRPNTTPFALLVLKQLGKLEERLRLAGEKWMKDNPSQILIIFDGLDQSKFSWQDHFAKTDHEAMTDPATIIANILSGHIYPGAKILTTSRWHSFWILDDDLKPDRIVALRGFLQDQIKDVFQQLLGSDACSILEHIEKNAPNLLFLCSTPNILLNTASLLSQSPDVRPETETAILSYLAKHLITVINSPVKIALIRNIAALAYSGIENGVFQFSPVALEEFHLLLSDLHALTTTNVALIPDQDKVLEMDLRCCFHHQTLQEFFAALHVALARGKIDSCIDKLFEDGKMENVLLFLCGIAANEQTFSVIKRHILSGSS